MRFFSRLVKLHSNDKGMALVTAMLVLVSMTVIGVTAMTNSTIDTMITGNNFHAQQERNASEGAARLVLEALPIMLSAPGTTLDTLLNWDGDTEGNPDGILTATGSGDAYALDLLVTPTGSPFPDINDLINPHPTVATYAVKIVDDDTDVPTPAGETGDMLTDQNGRVYLDVIRTFTASGIDTLELHTSIVRASMIDHDGTINLIDPNSIIDYGILNSSAPYSVTGLTDFVGATLKEGIITTDNTPTQQGDDPANGKGQILPAGDVVDDLMASPTALQINEFKDDLLRYSIPIMPTGPGTSVVISGEDHTLGKPGFPQVSYVKGDLVIENGAYGEGILIIEEYNDGTNDHMSLTMSSGRFNGLIIIYPENASPNFTEPVKIQLNNSGLTGFGHTEINGIIVAGSSSPYGVQFNIADDSIVDYDQTDANAILSNRFVVEKWMN